MACLDVISLIWMKKNHLAVVFFHFFVFVGIAIFQRREEDYRLFYPHHLQA